MRPLLAAAQGGHGLTSSGRDGGEDGFALGLLHRAWPVVRMRKGGTRARASKKKRGKKGGRLRGVAQARLEKAAAANQGSRREHPREGWRERAGWVAHARCALATVLLSICGALGLARKLACLLGFPLAFLSYASSLKACLAIPGCNFSHLFR